MFKHRYQYLPFWIAAFVAVIFFFSSCGTFKKNLHKSEVHETASVETKTQESINTASQAAVSRTITEETNTVVTVPEATAQASGTQKDLDSDAGIYYEDADLVLNAKKDSSGHVVFTAVRKKKEIPVKGKRTTEELINSIFNTTVAAVTDQKVEVEKEVETKDVEKERVSGVNWTMIWIVAICLVLLLVAFFIWFYLPRRRRSE